jgi:pyruvate/2-oxoglutarate dehydrogenase complex dihydrolipoamide acyltransferase (E2) component
MSKQWKIAAALAVVLLGGWLLLRWAPWQAQGPGPGFVSGNGRIEATEIAVATKLAGRVLDVLVAEGDFVKAGQPLARMQIDGLQAQREEAVPSVTPGQAAQHFEKIECFCFDQQTLAPGEAQEMPLAFIVSPEVDRNISHITLSYAFFSIEGQRRTLSATAEAR